MTGASYKTITEWLAYNNLGIAQPGDYLVGNRGAGNTGGIILPHGIDTFNVKDYGALGDGVTDDAAAINAAIIAAQATTYGANIVFPAGNYIVGSVITVPTSSKAIYLQGAGQGITTLTRKSSYTAGDIIYAPTSSSFQLGISYLTIGNGAGITVTSGAAIHVNNRSFVDIHEVTIYDGFDGILVNGAICTNIVVTNFIWYQTQNIQCNSCITIDGHVANMIISDSVLSGQNCFTLGTQVTYGIRFLCSDGVQVSNCYLSAKSGIRFDNISVTTMNYAVITNCIIDGCDGYGIVLAGTAASTFNNIRITDTHIVPGIQNVNSKAILITGNCDNVMFRNCDLGVSNLSAIDIAGPANAWHGSPARDISFIGCSVEDSEISGGTVGGIVVRANQAGVRIQDCYVGKAGTTSYSPYGIRLEGPNSNITITGNNLLNNASGGITFSLGLVNTNYPNLVIVGNTGYADRLLQSNIYDTNGNIGAVINATPNAVNYLLLFNGATGSSPEVQALGTDTNVGLNIRARGTGNVNIVTANLTNPMSLFSGTASQHTTNFLTANTAATRNVTFPDASGTLLYDTGSTNITTLGTVTTGVWNGTVIPMGYGGTSNNLTPSNGGVIYSNATQMAVLSGTATASKMLLSGATAAPTWSTSTVPSSAGSINNILKSDGTNWTAAAGTGSGSPVLGTSPTMSTPVINGFTDGSSAAAGVVGETLKTAYVTGVALSTGTPANVTSLALTAGDWDLWGIVASAPAGTTTTTFFFGALNTSSGSVPSPTTEASSRLYAAGVQTTAGQPMSGMVPMQSVSISGTTTYYLNIVAGFAISTMTCNGQIIARRRR